MKYLAWLRLNYFLGLAALLCLNSLSCRRSTSTVEGDISTLLTMLTADNFTVQEGKYTMVDPIQLCNDGILNTCNGNNVGNPYYTYVLPMAPTQTVQNEVPFQGGYLNYRLAADEAIVMVGRTPPEMMYFSYRSFLFTRYYSDIARQFKIFGALGDTINSLTVSTECRSAGPFNQPMIIVTTADRGIFDRIKTAAAAAGYPAEIINLDLLPSGILTQGLTYESDTFSFLARTAMPIDLDGFENYKIDPGCRVFRLTPNSATTLDPYPLPTLKPRGTGSSEAWLQSAVDDLRAAILDAFPASSYETTELTTEIWLPETLDFLTTRQDLIGESRDTPYFRTNLASRFTLADDPNEFLIVYGVNHMKTGKCTYSNFIVYGEKYLNGVASVASTLFEGSADVYIPGHAQANYLYAWKVARSVDGSAHCLAVPFGPQRNGWGTDANDQYGFVGFRAYLEPSTTVGAKWEELIWDRVIKFKKK